ncbi:esterase/lipase family protein [Wielerella bovis]|uniref:esterase/lipase family protein n=1 Tax=Wielerella bovis TaxID=2917790 RepID=UPI0020193DBF|nr:alpha/beta hydrolase [Wielerella bovis]MCG7656164.1 alpha/beta hydrolase [Wielerella bovis]MCG7658389.1 alpha/beta hydrolase [Wielerella bovis]
MSIVKVSGCLFIKINTHIIIHLYFPHRIPLFTAMNSKQVILLHGLYTSPLIMKPLGTRLAAHGFEPHYFAYTTTHQSLRQHAHALADFVRRENLSPCHFVAHSLGGLLLRHLADIAPELVQARVVTLGSPHQGSAAAKRVHHIHAGLLGDSWQNALDGDLPPQPFPVPCGNIAGNLGTGLGRLLLALPEPNDGTVALAETQLPESVQLVVPCGHTGLLFSEKVAKQVAYFLQNGTFLNE